VVVDHFEELALVGICGQGRASVYCVVSEAALCRQK
jgi:hypothetical protein